MDAVDIAGEGTKQLLALHRSGDGSTSTELDANLAALRKEMVRTAIDMDKNSRTKKKHERPELTLLQPPKTPPGWPPSDGCGADIAVVGHRGRNAEGG